MVGTGKEFDNTFRQLEKLLPIWKKEAQRLVSGPPRGRYRGPSVGGVTEWILRRRSGRLWKAFRSIGPRKNISGKMLDYYIKLQNLAKDPRTGFKYAGYHEFESGRRFLRPALLWSLDPRNPQQKVHGLTRAMAEDSLDYLLAGLIQSGWRPGVMPRSCTRSVTIYTNGAGVTGGMTESVHKLSNIPQYALRNFGL